MEKTIVIDGKDVKLNNNGGWALEYQEQFGKDILPVMLPLVGTIGEAFASILAETDGDAASIRSIAEALQGRTMDILLPMIQVNFVEMVYYVTWALAKNADPDIPEPKRWIRQFDNFPLDEVVPEVYGLILKGYASSKKLMWLEEIKADLTRKLQPSQQMTSSSQDSSEG